MDFFQVTCFKESRNMTIEKNLRITINLYKKLCLQLSHQIENICRSKLYQQHTQRRESFLQLLLLKVPCHFFPDRVKNL